MLDFMDRVLVLVERIVHIARVVWAWIRWVGQVVAHLIRHFAPIVAPYFRMFGRTAILVIAGLVIPFIPGHGNVIGLMWLTTISVVSLAVKDDCGTPITTFVWWLNVVFTGSAALGLILGTIGPASALSLAIPLALFECARAFVRSESVAGWGSAALALTLAIIVFPSGTDSTIATGTIGAWAIVLGVFGAISQSETLLETGKKVIRRVTKR